MTEQEAIKRLEFLNDALNFNRADSDESSCALQMGIEVLEKQIPKKPIDRCMFKECPDCHEIEIQYCNYCPTCGQKLDWSDESGS